MTPAATFAEGKFANGAVTGAFAYAFGSLAQRELSYETLEGPTQGPDGQANWRIKWRLDAPSEEGGWVVQEMTVDIVAAGGERHEHYWEAWPVPAGADRAYGSDTWGIDGRRYSSGAATWTGTARFHEGLTLPNSFSRGAVTAAGSAWATRTNPNLPTSPQPVSRVFVYPW